MSKRGGPDGSLRKSGDEDVSKSTCSPRARGAFRVYAYTAQVDAAIHAHPPLFVGGTTR